MLTFLKRRREVAPAALDVPVGEKLPRAEVGGGAHLREYEAVARRIGFDNRALLAAQLKDFVAEQEIPVYKYDRVHAFLVAKMQEDPTVKRRERWCWAPLREVEVKLKLFFPGQRSKRKNGHIAPNQYGRAVPLKVLQLVEKFTKKFGDKVCFYVSEYASENADPFLMLAPPGITPMIIAHWDEPGFTG